MTGENETRIIISSSVVKLMTFLFVFLFVLTVSDVFHYGLKVC